MIKEGRNAYKKAKADGSIDQAKKNPKCPGCGAQRFAYHLMHGDILGAVHYNYFVALLAPYLLLLLSGELIPSRRWRQYVHTHFVTKFYCLFYVVLYFLWWVLRNILGL